MTNPCGQIYRLKKDSQTPPGCTAECAVIVQSFRDYGMARSSFPDSHKKKSVHLVNISHAHTTCEYFSRARTGTYFHTVSEEYAMTNTLRLELVIDRVPKVVVLLRALVRLVPCKLRAYHAALSREQILKILKSSLTRHNNNNYKSDNDVMMTTRAPYSASSFLRFGWENLSCCVSLRHEWA